MILTCPSCGTQYAIKDGAIPPAGRKVRCAACGHSWHQDPQAGDSDQAALPAPEPGSASGDPAVPFPEAADRSGEPELEGYAPADPLASDAGLVEGPTAIPVLPPGEEPWPEPSSDEEEWEPEKEIPDAEEIAAAEQESGDDRKRNLVRGALIALVLVGLIVAALWLLAPDSLRQRIGFAGGSATPLQIAPGTPERQKLASGNELVIVSGKIINPSSTAQQVPPIEAQLRDRSGRLLYSWTIAPPARSLPPGGSATFNSAEMKVPPSGLDSTVTLTLKG